MNRSLLVTGGAGFIGSNFLRTVAELHPSWRLTTLDKLTYAGNLDNLESVDHTFTHGDVAEPDDVNRAFDAAGEDAIVVHFAAESHVDRSIQDGLPFLRSNVVGTQVLLDVARARGAKRFVHISTDEVYGSVAPGESRAETDRLNPTNPYSASKAASDHLVLAAVNTHGIDAVVTRCSNNYGPYQFPEKFIPLMIANATEDKELPVYGDGLYERDWIYVRDHCEAVLAVLERGVAGEIYNVAGRNHRTNIDALKFILKALDKPESLIRHVADRPGHDRRYAPDDSKIESALGWRPRFDFETAMRDTIRWYADNAVWVERARSGEYRKFYDAQYGERLNA
ncbi:MAG: dTDP-glucose 4,6-dehydratase [Planctomycetota bacterium]|nr:dTDP-glucose 4,6-dehydratase [Planctomycetota bacterium]